MAGEPWEHTPCATCNPSEPSHKGRSHVSLDTDVPAVWAIEEDGSDRVEELPTEAQALSKQEVKDGLKVILDLMRENPVTAKIVIFRIVNPYKLKEIADAEGLSIQAARDRLIKAIRKWPELAAFVSIREYTKKK